MHLDVPLAVQVYVSVTLFLTDRCLLKHPTEHDPFEMPRRICIHEIWKQAVILVDDATRLINHELHGIHEFIMIVDRVEKIFDNPVVIVPEILRPKHSHISHLRSFGETTHESSSAHTVFVRS